LFASGEANFWGENEGGFVWWDFGHPYFWAKIKSGHLKKDEKLKKKLQKVFKKREKRGKVRKIEKKDAKRCGIWTVFSKSGIFLVSGAFRAGRSWWRLGEMLKWVR
jgi:hypothetical protein